MFRQNFILIYAEPYQEVKRRWTAPDFIERIRDWLAKTARGELHQNDQALEPLLLEMAVPIVIPADLFAEDKEGNLEKLIISADDVKNPKFLIAQHWPETLPKERHGLVATALTCHPQKHGIVYKKPSNLAELHQFMLKANFDLLNELRRRFQAWLSDKEKLGNFLANPLILIIRFPKKRREGSAVEATELRAFITGKSVLEIGKEIGVWDVHNGSPGYLLEVDDSKRGDTIGLDLLNPSLTLSRSTAAHLNGLEKGYEDKIAAIGVGALGSQIIMNLVRSGYGKWTLIDDDVLLPHNLARHELGGCFIGCAKSQALAHEANAVIEGAATSIFIVLKHVCTQCHSHS